MVANLIATVAGASVAVALPTHVAIKGCKVPHTLYAAIVPVAATATATAAAATTTTATTATAGAGCRCSNDVRAATDNRRRWRLRYRAAAGLHNPPRQRRRGLGVADRCAHLRQLALVRYQPALQHALVAVRRCRRVRFSPRRLLRLYHRALRRCARVPLLRQRLSRRRHLPLQLLQPRARRLAVLLRGATGRLAQRRQLLLQHKPVALQVLHLLAQRRARRVGGHVVGAQALVLLRHVLELHGALRGAKVNIAGARGKLEGEERLVGGVGAGTHGGHHECTRGAA